MRPDGGGGVAVGGAARRTSAPEVGGPGAGGVQLDGGCDSCDPYIKETVAMYFDLLYQEWSNSSLAMVILKVSLTLRVEC